MGVGGPASELPEGGSAGKSSLRGSENPAAHAADLMPLCSVGVSERWAPDIDTVTHQDPGRRDPWDYSFDLTAKKLFPFGSCNVLWLCLRQPFEMEYSVVLRVPWK